MLSFIPGIYPPSGTISGTGNFSSRLWIFVHCREDILPSDLGGNGKMGPMDNQHNVLGLRKMDSFFQEIKEFGYE